jgi:predicted ester cyclase
MTHQGEFMGIASTGKPVTASGQGFVRVRDGKIVEEHEVFDAFGLMQQLGAVPESADVRLTRDGPVATPTD